DPRRYFLRRLLERLGLLRALTESTEAAGPAETPRQAEGRLVAADPTVMARFLAHPLAERLRICVRLWVAGGWWADGKPGDAPSSPHGLHTPAQPRVALARRRLVEGLSPHSGRASSARRRKQPEQGNANRATSLRSATR